MQKPLLLDAGSGGRASQRLISDLFARHFSNDILNVMDDAALLNIDGPVAMSTDTYTVTPLFFPGGSIGTLAVHGTVNDVSMLGACERSHGRSRAHRHGPQGQTFVCERSAV